MLCPSVIFSNFTQSLKDRWDLLFTEASLCYLFHKPKKKTLQAINTQKTTPPQKKPWQSDHIGEESGSCSVWISNNAAWRRSKSLQCIHEDVPMLLQGRDWDCTFLLLVILSHQLAFGQHFFIHEFCFAQPAGGGKI